MYFPYLRGRQFELLALRELIENNRINDMIIPIIEPIKPTMTLIKTLQSFIRMDRKIAVVWNPMVGSFTNELARLNQNESKVAKELNVILMENENIIKVFIMNEQVEKVLKSGRNRSSLIIVNTDRNYLDSFLSVYETESPMYTLIPDDRAFKRIITKNRVLFEDRFKKRQRNVDYLGNCDEFFSDDHIFYKNEGYAGFADYSIIGREFNEAGFAPLAVAIHLVYYGSNKELRIQHFVSDSNEDIKDPGKKFGEALSKLVIWCDKNEVAPTLGLEGFYNCFHTGRYPGLGTVKKYSIMHHLEIISKYLEGGK